MPTIQWPSLTASDEKKYALMSKNGLVGIMTQVRMGNFLYTLLKLNMTFLVTLCVEKNGTKKTILVKQPKKFLLVIKTLVCKVIKKKQHTKCLRYLTGYAISEKF